MSRGPENTFIASVHRHLPESVYRMKNHNEYNGGIPDCWYSGRSNDLWVEYKFVEVPKRPKTDIKVNELLSSLQMEWLAARHVEGRNLAVIVGSKNGGVWFDELMWEYPLTAEAYLAALQDRKSLAERITEAVDG